MIIMGFRTNIILTLNLQFIHTTIVNGLSLNVPRPRNQFMRNETNTHRELGQGNLKSIYLLPYMILWLQHIWWMKCTFSREFNFLKNYFDRVENAYVFLFYIVAAELLLRSVSCLAR